MRRHNRHRVVAVRAFGEARIDVAIEDSDRADAVATPGKSRLDARTRRRVVHVAVAPQGIHDLVIEFGVKARHVDIELVEERPVETDFDAVPGLGAETHIRDAVIAEHLVRQRRVVEARPLGEHLEVVKGTPVDADFARDLALRPRVRRPCHRRPIDVTRKERLSARTAEDGQRVKDKELVAREQGGRIARIIVLDVRLDVEEVDLVVGSDIQTISEAEYVGGVGVEQLPDETVDISLIFAHIGDVIRLPLGVAEGEGRGEEVFVVKGNFGVRRHTVDIVVGAVVRRVRATRVVLPRPVVATIPVVSVREKASGEPVSRVGVERLESERRAVLKVLANSALHRVGFAVAVVAPAVGMVVRDVAEIREAEVFESAARARVEADLTQIAAMHFERGLPRVVVGVRHDVDDASGGVAAVEDGLRAVEDFDALNRTHRDAKEVLRGHVGVVDFLAVDDDLHTPEAVRAIAAH